MRDCMRTLIDMGVFDLVRELAGINAPWSRTAAIKRE